MNKAEEQPQTPFHYDSFSVAEEKKVILFDVLNKIRNSIKEGNFDKLLKEILEETSELRITLENLDIHLCCFPSTLPSLEKYKNSPMNVKGRDAQAIYSILTSGCGTVPVIDSEVLMFMYFPEQKIWEELEVFSPELVLELRKAICLIFAEEYAHSLQNILAGKEEGPYFISEAMKHESAPPVGYIRRKFVELDIVLFLTEQGFGPHIKESLWLAAHENEYGRTMGMSQFAGLKLSEEISQWFIG